MRNRPSQARKPPQPRKRGLLAAALAAAFTALACVLAAPTPALASPCAHSYGADGSTTWYETIDEAIKDGYNGKTIIMDADWYTEVYSGDDDMDIGGITVEAGKKLTIDMNGHTVNNKSRGSVAMLRDTPTFSVQKNAELVLTANDSARNTKIAYKGFDPADETSKESRVDCTATTGGLVTNTSNWMPGILVCQSAKLTLDGVTVAGCYGSFTVESDKTYYNSKSALYGGITLYEDSTLNMKNGASIEHNASLIAGAGVYITGSNATVNMEGSFIHHNRAYARSGRVAHGGGIYAWGSNTRIEMSGDSKVYSNLGEAGGGIYFNASGFTVTSSDGKAYISNNRAVHSDRGSQKYHLGGGGIHVASNSSDGLIENVTISDNYSAYDGGGIELDQKNTTLRKCTIKDNWCKYEGGGICVSSDGNVIDGCTITGNYCDDDESNYEGGGVFVGCQYDLGMCGTCVIKGNTRRANSGDADDVFLNANVGATMKAYIVGTLESGSSVGVRTGTTGDRRVAKGFKPKSKDCLFYDMSGYYVSYGADEGGDAWQRHTTKEFTVSLDGQVYGKYRNGSAVALAVPQTKGGKVFWRWDTGSNGTTGLYPLGDYFTEKGALSNALSFTMPQNDVGLAPLYTDKVTAVRFQVEAPEAGRALAATGKLWRTDGGASAGSAPCSVYWYEVDEDGNVSDTSATGLAKANTAYKAYLAAPEAADLGFFYDKEVSAAVSLVSSSGDLVYEPKDIKTYVTLSNSLAAHVDDAYTTGAGEGATIGTVKVRLKDKGLLGQGGGGAAAASLVLDAEGGAGAQAGIGDTVEVSYAYDEDTDAVTIAAPALEGYNFCAWDVEGGYPVSDEGAVEIPVSDLKEIEALTASYTPVVTRVELETDEPAPAAGEKLATGVKALVLTASDGRRVDLSAAAVAWSPEEEDGLAGYSTAYTALVGLMDADGLEGVEKVVASDAEVGVTCAGAVVEAEGAGFTVVGGQLCLAVSFPATRDARVTSVSAPADVELTFEQAKACAELGIWPLQKSVDLKVESGVAAEGDVEWEAVEGFDASATGAQALTAKGKVTRVAAADGSEVDADGASLEVAATIKVAAPAASENQGGGERDNGEKKEDAGKTKTAAKKGVPATGDASFSAAAGLLAAAGACLVAAVRFARRER